MHAFLATDADSGLGIIIIITVAVDSNPPQHTGYTTLPHGSGIPYAVLVLYSTSGKPTNFKKKTLDCPSEAEKEKRKRKEQDSNCLRNISGHVLSLRI